MSEIRSVIVRLEKKSQIKEIVNEWHWEKGKICITSHCRLKEAIDGLVVVPQIEKRYRKHEAR